MTPKERAETLDAQLRHVSAVLDRIEAKREKLDGVMANLAECHVQTAEFIARYLRRSSDSSSN